MRTKRGGPDKDDRTPTEFLADFKVPKEGKYQIVIQRGERREGVCGRV